jgi:hypothetical protein
VLALKARFKAKTFGGGWVYKGDAFLDLAHVFTAREFKKAIIFAIEKYQLGIFDLRHKVEIHHAEYPKYLTPSELSKYSENLRIIAERDKDSG